MKTLTAMTLVIAAMAAFGAPTEAQTMRVKDLVEVAGADHNFLIGEGLVIGLTGTGDTPKGPAARLLRNAIASIEGIGVSDAELTTKNVALVAVTAELPPFQEKDTRIDVTVACMGDAKSLKGGLLLLTPLRGPRAKEKDPTVYALAQGPVYLGGDTSLTVAKIPQGAIVKKSLENNFVRNGRIMLSLDQGDLCVAYAVARAVNEQFKRSVITEGDTLDVDNIAKALDGGKVEVTVPESYVGNEVCFMNQIVLGAPVDLMASEETKAKVVINETTKTYAVTGFVMVSPVIVQTRSGAKLSVPLSFPAPLPKRPGETPEDYLKRSQEWPEKAANLKAVLEVLAEGGRMTPDEIIEMIREIHRAGALKGELVIER
jgi:flagellar P-ring protein precursor FlgI